MTMISRLARAGLWPLRRALRSASVDVVAFGPTSADWQLLDAIRRRGIASALDVGANRGQFAKHLRDRGFIGLIHSFEPLDAPFAELAAMAARDGRQVAHRLALSDKAGEAEIFVGENDQTSSLQRVGVADGGSGIADAHRVAGSVRIQTDRLDLFCARERIDPSTAFLKLDVQGHEMTVLAGAGDLLAEIPLLQLELSILPIYEGETRFGDAIAFIQGKGFKVRAIRPGYFDPDDSTLAQVDVIAERA